MWKRPEFTWTVRFRLAAAGLVQVQEIVPPQLPGASPDEWLGRAVIKVDEWGSAEGFRGETAKVVTRSVAGRRVGYRLNSVDRTSRATVAPLLPAPTPGGEDPILGRVVSKAVTDFRTKVTTVMNPDGSVRNTQAAPVQPETPESGQRWIGWVAGCAALAVVVVIVRKHRGL